MILVDTSVWSDHLRRCDSELTKLLEAGEVLMHPYVVGELACGLFPRRSEVLRLLDALPSVPMLGQAEVLGFMDRHALPGRGVGFVDVHLLASAIVSRASLWTRDRRLARVAYELGASAVHGR